MVEAVEWHFSLILWCQCETAAHLVCSSCSSLAPDHVLQTYGHHLLQPGCTEASRLVSNRGLWDTLTLQSLHPIRQDKWDLSQTWNKTLLLIAPQRLTELLLYWKWILSSRLSRGMMVGVDRLKCGNRKFKLVNKCHLFHHTEFKMYSVTFPYTSKWVNIFSIGCVFYDPCVRFFSRFMTECFQFGGVPKCALWER